MWSVPIPGERPLYWVGTSKKDILGMPQPVRRAIGLALGVAQQGGKHPGAKPWKGAGTGVFEIVCRFDTDAFRAVYTVCFKEVIYVLHCFQKKSPRARKTARTDIDLIHDRLKVAQADHEKRYGKESS